MKILYIITQGEQGGGQKYVLELAEKVAKEHEVFVGIGRMENGNDKWLFEKLESVGVKKGNIFEIKNLQREIKPILDFKALLEMSRLFKMLNPDVVHLNSSKSGVVGAVASIFTKTKVVYTVHGWVFLEPMNPIKKLIYISLEFISAMLRNYTIFITQKDIDAVALWPLFKGKGKLIYNGIDESKKENILSKEEGRKFIFEKIPHPNPENHLQDDSISKERELVPEVKIVGTISNLFKTKGLEYLIDAAKDVDAIFVVFGFGGEEYRQELQDRINRNGLQEKFFLLGRVPDAYKYLRALDVFTLTSVKEGLPYSILEASLANLPIVATSVGGVPEVAKNIKISLVESQNVQQIRSAIEENLNNSEKYKSEFNKIYTIENMVSQTLGVYKKMVD